MKFYISDGRKYVDCFKLKNVDRRTLIRSFMTINNMISPIRDNLSESNKWNILSLFFDSTGRVRGKFDYDDISKDAISYEQRWKDKWLK